MPPHATFGRDEHTAMVIAVILLPPVIATLLLLLLNAPFILELLPQPPCLSNGTSTATLPTALAPPSGYSPCPAHSPAWPYAVARAAALIVLSAVWLSWVVHGFAELCGRAVEVELEEDAELRHARVARRRVEGC